MEFCNFPWSTIFFCSLQALMPIALQYDSDFSDRRMGEYCQTTRFYIEN